MRSRVLLGAVLIGLLSGPAVLAADPDPNAPSPAGQPAKRTKLKHPKPEAGAEGAPAGPTLPAPMPASADPTVRTDVSKQGWSIVLAVFRGDEQVDAARVLLTRVRGEGGLPEAYAQKRNLATVIALGDYPSAEDARAQVEIRRVQEIVVGGSRPYVGAYLAPPPAGEIPGRMPQYNLVRAREQYGEKALYTVQVGVYGRDELPSPTEADLAEARRAAEQAAYRLRQEGEQAYYYHGTHRSMVTVGVFDESDYDPQASQFKSQRLREVGKRFPYNLYNGAAIREKRKGEAEGHLQPSVLVVIPKK